MGVDLGDDQRDLGIHRQPDELSTTIAPAAATLGANSLEAVFPLENSARSSPAKSAVAESSTVIFSSPNGSRLPADRADAKYRISSTGNFRSTSRCPITPPT